MPTTGKMTTKYLNCVPDSGTYHFSLLMSIYWQNAKKKKKKDTISSKAQSRAGWRTKIILHSMLFKFVWTNIQASKNSSTDLATISRRRQQWPTRFRVLSLVLRNHVQTWDIISSLQLHFWLSFSHRPLPTFQKTWAPAMKSQKARGGNMLLRAITFGLFSPHDGWGNTVPVSAQNNCQGFEPSLSFHTGFADNFSVFFISTGQAMAGNLSTGQTNKKTTHLVLPRRAESFQVSRVLLLDQQLFLLLLQLFFVFLQRASFADQQQ